MTNGTHRKGSIFRTILKIILVLICLIIAAAVYVFVTDCSWLTLTYERKSNNEVSITKYKCRGLNIRKETYSRKTITPERSHNEIVPQEVNTTEESKVDNNSKYKQEEFLVIFLDDPSLLHNIPPPSYDNSGDVIPPKHDTPPSYSSVGHNSPPTYDGTPSQPGSLNYPPPAYNDVIEGQTSLYPHLDTIYPSAPIEEDNNTDDTFISAREFESFSTVHNENDFTDISSTESDILNRARNN